MQSLLFTVSIAFLGMIDSSGLRFYYTKQLRKYDAGVLQVGSVVGYTLMIPPRETNWKINGFCSEECTSEVCLLTNCLLLRQFPWSFCAFFSFVMTRTSRGLSSLPKQDKKCREVVFPI